MHGQSFGGRFGFFNSISASRSRGLHSAATRLFFGKDSLSSSSRLTLRSYGITVRPVTFPPGFAKLLARPIASRLPLVMTIGSVRVIRRAAIALFVAVVTMTSTLSRTSSAASSASRSSVPSA